MTFATPPFIKECNTLTIVSKQTQRTTNERTSKIAPMASSLSGELAKTPFRTPKCNNGDDAKDDGLLTISI